MVALDAVNRLAKGGVMGIVPAAQPCPTPVVAEPSRSPLRWPRPFAPGEAVDAAHDGEDRGRDDEADARDREQPPDAWVVDGGGRDRLLGRRDLFGQGPASRVSRSSGGSSSAPSQARPRTPSTSVIGARTRCRESTAATRLRTAVRSRTRPERCAVSRRSRRVASSGCQTGGR